MARGQIGSVLLHLHKLLGASPAGEMTDGQLLERFLQRGEQGAFELLVRRHGAMVLRVCQRVLNDAHAAEDAFQATFVILVRKAGGIRRHESLASWLYGVAFRVARRARTTVCRRQHRETQLFDLPGGIPEPGEGGELRRVLDEELLRLGDRHRAPLVLCYLEGKTYQEAAQQLGWSEGSMSRRLAQARERLRQRLVRRGYAISGSAVVAALGADAQATVPAAWLTTTVQIAGGSASASPAVLALSQGVMQPMLLTKCKAAMLVLLGIALCSAGAGLLAGDYAVRESRCEAIAPALAIFPEPGSGEDCPQDLNELPNMMELEPPGNASEGDPMPPIDYDELDRLSALPSAAKIAKRRDLRSEEEHRQALQRVPELDLDTDRAQRDGTKAILKRTQTDDWKPAEHFTAKLLEGRADLGKLPITKGRDCELTEEQAGRLFDRSRMLRGLLVEASDGASSPAIVAAALRINFIKSEQVRERFDNTDGVPALMQMLTAEAAPVRRVLVEQLTRLTDPTTTKALAQLALFDLSPDVRADAVSALSQRPANDYRTALLAGFNYPWAPVADHAAEALVALRDQAAVSHLRRLADLPDPATAREGQVAELVRINHLRNCMMCHAPAPTRQGRVLGPVPNPGEPLPPPIVYYSSQDPKFIVVRADMTYLRQDFSAPQPVTGTAPWPEVQRYDYLVRQRPASPAEQSKSPAREHPQREAVLWAIRELEAK